MRRKGSAMQPFEGKSVWSERTVGLWRGGRCWGRLGQASVTGWDPYKRSSEKQVRWARVQMGLECGFYFERRQLREGRFMEPRNLPNFLLLGGDWLHTASVKDL